MSIKTEVDRIKAKVGIIRNKFVSLELAKSTDNIDALATAAYYIEKVGIGKPTISTTAYDEDNEIAIRAKSNQSQGYVVAKNQLYVETYATLTVDGNKVTMECKGAKIERTVGTSIATCTVTITRSTNTGACLISATTFANGAFSVFNSDATSGTVTIPNVVCGSSISVNTSYPVSFYGWTYGQKVQRSSMGGTLTAPTTSGTYTVDIGVLDD